MNFYFFWFAIILIICVSSNLSIKEINGNIKIYDSFYYVAIIYCGIIFFFISSLRFNVGTDYIAYQGYFKKNILGLPLFEALKKSELFFVLFSNLSYKLFGNLQLLYSILAFVVIFFTFKGISFYEKNYFLPILFFIITTSFFISLNAMRQMASFSLFLYATRYIYQKKFWHYMFFILIAFFWHTSAVFYIPCYFLCRISLQKKYFILLIISFGLKKILNVLIINIMNAMGLEMAYYFVTQEGASSKTFIFISIVINICFLVFCKEKKSDVSNFLFNISLIETFIAILGDGIPGSFRLMYLFWPMNIIICPYIIKKSNIKVFPLIIFLSIFSFFFWKAQILSNTHEVVPYHSILKNIL